MKNKKEDKTEKHEKKDAEDVNVSELQDQIGKLKQEKDEMFSQLQRVVADFDNYQKRAPKQIADSVRYEKEKMIKMLLPILDNFEHTISSAELADCIEIVLKGVKIVYDQVHGVLKSYGVEIINGLGEKFDPSLHEAMMRKDDAGYEDNVVIEEFQKGYKLGDHVLRPSRVIVNKRAGETKPEEVPGEKQAEKTEEKLEESPEQQQSQEGEGLLESDD